ncbi:MAG TPA: hypothetical protein VF006_29675 [Longimicrobium sp.]
MSAELGEVFLEREYDVDGREGAAVLRIGRPAEHPEGDWYCPFQIAGLRDDEVYEACGVDSLQALSMCLQMARAQLQSYRKSHQITWLGADGLGL